MVSHRSVDRVCLRRRQPNLLISSQFAYMNTTFTTAVTLALLSPMANAALVGLNFQGNGQANLLATTTAGSNAGTIIPQLNWNNASNSNNVVGTIPNLVSSTGSPSGIAASWNGPDGWNAGGAVGASGNAQMSYGFFKSNNGSPQIPSGNVTVTFSGFTSGSLFDMVIYTATDNPSPLGTFTLNNSANTSVSYNIGTGNVATFTDNSTRRAFTNLTAVGNSVTLTMSGAGAGLTGIQFSNIPEPSSALFIGLSVLGFLAGRTRRRA